MATTYHQVWINDAPAEVYSALASPEGINPWWDPRPGPAAGRRVEGAMTARAIRALAVLASLLLGPWAAAQDSELSDCPVDPVRFALFEKDLKAALAKPDPWMTALLVRYPLRVNESSGTIEIENEAALLARFDDVFPPEVRKAVVETKDAGSGCLPMGILFGNGTVWVNAVGEGTASYYAVTVVNLPGASGGSGLDFTCHADDRRLVVETDAEGVLRLRAWSLRRSLADPPDLVAGPGALAVEGTGLCRHAIWTFRTGATSYVLAELGCGEDVPPRGARGELVIAAEGAGASHSWCF